jgi:aminoglycoside N3'-acetyltransferase
MPTFPFTGRVTEYAATDPVFDPLRTPSRMGLLTEMFRRHPDVVRSVHPTHPVAALGARAAWLVAGHEESPTPFGPETPFGRLYESDGQVLLLGVGLESMTLVHVVEDLMGDRFPVAVYEEEPARLQVLTHDGGLRQLSVRLHAAAVSVRRDSSVLLRPLLEQNIAHRSTLAGIEMTLVEARGLVAMLRIEAQEGRTIYGGF